MHADDWLSTSGFHPRFSPPAFRYDDWRQPFDLDGAVAWAGVDDRDRASLSPVWRPPPAPCTRVTAGLFADPARLRRARRSARRVHGLEDLAGHRARAVPVAERRAVVGRRVVRRRRDPKHVAPPISSRAGASASSRSSSPVFYCSSGIVRRRRGDWLQLPVRAVDAPPRLVPDAESAGSSRTTCRRSTWTVMQALTLRVRDPRAAVVRCCRGRGRTRSCGRSAMHLMIGLMFGPVIWFSLLMITLLVGELRAGALTSRRVFERKSRLRRGAQHRNAMRSVR